jgi:hypothetical protein
VMPVPVELLRFFDRAAGGIAAAGDAPAAEDAPDSEPEDLGDAEVAAAEAAISHTPAPALGESTASVPELTPGSSQLTDPAISDTETPSDATTAAVPRSRSEAAPDAAPAPAPGTDEGTDGEAATARVGRPRSGGGSRSSSSTRSGTSSRPAPGTRTRGNASNTTDTP